MPFVTVAQFDTGAQRRARRGAGPGPRTAMPNFPSRRM